MPKPEISNKVSILVIMVTWVNAYLYLSYYFISHSQMRTELYFLSSQKNRPSLFGMPLIVPCTVHTRKKDLYDAVWIQVSRLASPLPPQEASNHAQDWWVCHLTLWLEWCNTVAQISLQDLKLYSSSSLSVLTSHNTSLEWTCAFSIYN